MKLITQDKIDDHWDSVKHYIQQALDVANEYSRATIRKKLKCNEASLAISDDGKFVCVLNVYECDRGKVLNIFLAAGDFEGNAIEADKFMDKLANTEGCDSIIMTGRTGWKKHAANFGYKVISTQIQKWL